MPASPSPPPSAATILFVDDNLVARKWFAASLADEFEIVCATTAEEAREILAKGTRPFSVLVTDLRLPGESGMDLLRHVHTAQPHLVPLLATAYAEKKVAIEAINEGFVFQILEKPLEDQSTRAALRLAVAQAKMHALQRMLHEERVNTLRYTLGFLAHELNTPLTTVRGLVATMEARHQADEPDKAVFRQSEPGEMMRALDSADRRTMYCQSILNSFLQSAKEVQPGSRRPPMSAAGLVKKMLAEYPFEDHERQWVTPDIGQDFFADGQRDLLYLVLCTLLKNALYHLVDRPAPSLRIEVGALNVHPARGWIRFVDTGTGISPDVLQRLTRQPVTTHQDRGGSGMGLMFCQHVMQGMGGQVLVTSEENRGSAVTLTFEQGVRLVTPAAVGAA